MPKKKGDSRTGHTVQRGLLYTRYTRGVGDGAVNEVLKKTSEASVYRSGLEVRGA